MNVVVHFHRAAEADLSRWQHGLNTDPELAEAFARLFLAELIAEMQRKQGRPGGAFYVGDAQSGSWWWHFASRAWVRYRWIDRPASLLRPLQRDVYIIGLSADSPDETGGE